MVKWKVKKGEKAQVVRHKAMIRPLAEAFFLLDSAINACGNDPPLQKLRRALQINCFKVENVALCHEILNQVQDDIWKLCCVARFLVDQVFLFDLFAEQEISP